MKAVVVFHDHSCHWLARFLRPGFRHVFVTVLNGNYWMRVDAMMGVPVVEVVGPAGFDMATFYRQEGHTVIETEQKSKPPMAPFAVANCVGLAKAVLCVRSITAVTPWRLYKKMGGR